MPELATHIAETKTAHFERNKFHDHYENALTELLKKKLSGQKFVSIAGREPRKVIKLMDALRQSVKTEKSAPPLIRGRKRMPSQTEMLFPIKGRKSTRPPLRSRLAQARKRNQRVSRRSWVHQTMRDHTRRQSSAAKGCCRRTSFAIARWTEISVNIYPICLHKI